MCIGMPNIPDFLVFFQLFSSFSFCIISFYMQVKMVRLTIFFHKFASMDPILCSSDKNTGMPSGARLKNNWSWQV